MQLIDKARGMREFHLAKVAELDEFIAKAEALEDAPEPGIAPWHGVDMASKSDLQVYGFHGLLGDLKIIPMPDAEMEKMLNDAVGEPAAEESDTEGEVEPAPEVKPKRQSKPADTRARQLTDEQVIVLEQLHAQGWAWHEIAAHLDVHGLNVMHRCRKLDRLAKRKKEEAENPPAPPAPQEKVKAKAIAKPKPTAKPAPAAAPCTPAEAAPPRKAAPRLPAGASVPDYSNKPYKQKADY